MTIGAESRFAERKSVTWIPDEEGLQAEGVMKAMALRQDSKEFA